MCERGENTIKTKQSPVNINLSKDLTMDKPKYSNLKILRSYIMCFYNLSSKQLRVIKLLQSF